MNGFINNIQKLESIRYVVGIENAGIIFKEDLNDIVPRHFSSRQEILDYFYTDSFRIAIDMLDLEPQVFFDRVLLFPRYTSIEQVNTLMPDQVDHYVTSFKAMAILIGFKIYKDIGMYGKHIDFMFDAVARDYVIFRTNRIIKLEG